MPQQLQAKMYFPAGGLNSDTNSLYLKDNEFAGVNNLRIKPNQIQTRTGCKKYGTVAFTDPILHFHTYKVPNGAELYFAFTKNNVYQYTVGTDSWESVLGTGVSFPGNITQWSVTDFIDVTEGATMVAAGSIPVGDVSAESDGSNRKLLYYKVSSGTNQYKFIDLVVNERLDIVDEQAKTGGYIATFPVTSGIKTNVDLGMSANTEFMAHVNATASETLVAGSFVVSTDQHGIIAYSDSTAISLYIAGVTKDFYSLIPVDPAKIKAGVNTAVSTDGKIISLYLLTSEFAGVKLKVSYTYQKASGFKPRFVKGYYNRLLLGGTYEESTTYYPWRVRWTELGQMNLIKYTSYQDLIETDVSPITGWEEQGFYLTVTKRQCIYKLSHVGGDLIFLFQVAWKHGCPAGRTLKNYNSTQYFLGEDDVYRWDGSALTSITLDQQSGNYRVKNAIMGMIGFSNILSIFSSLDLVNKEYWIWIPETTQTTVFVYSIPYDTWTKFTYARVISAANLGRFSTTSNGQIDSAVGSFDTYAGTMDDSVETLDKQQMFGIGGTNTAYSGKIYISSEKVTLDFAELSGSVYIGEDISSYLITKDFIYNDVYMMDRTQRVELDLYGSYVTIGWDGSFGTVPTSFKNQQGITLTPEWLRRYYYPDCVCYQIRLSLISTSFIALRLINLYALTSRLTNR